jgi:hypothetical protein
MTTIAIFLRDTVRMSESLKAELATLGFTTTEYQESLHTLIGDADAKDIIRINSHPAVTWVEQKITA